MTPDPLLDKIHALKQQLVMTAGAEFERVSALLQQAESDLADRELAAYLAERTDHPEQGPLTSAALVAEFLVASGYKVEADAKLVMEHGTANVAARGTHPLPPAVHAAPKAFAPGGEYRK